MKLIYLLLLTSCATTPTLKEQLDKQEITSGSVIDLAHQSYLRGCVEARVEILGKGKGKNIDHCREKSKKHRSDMTKILK
jgi:hypothetical protein